MNIQQLFAAGFGNNAVYQAPAGQDGAAAGSSGSRNDTSVDKKDNKGNDKTDKKDDKGDDKKDDKGDDKGDDEGDDNTPDDTELKKQLEAKESELEKQSGRASELEKQLQDVKTQLKQFEGVDVDKFNDLVKQAQDAETKELEAKGEWDRLKERMAEQHQSEIDKIREESEAKIKELTDQVDLLNGQFVEATIGNSFAASEFISKELVLTPNKSRTIYGSHFEVVDGKVVAYDKPAGASERTMIVDGKGDPVEFDEALRQIVDKDSDRDSILRSKAKPGADSETNNKSNPVSGSKELSSADKIKQGLSATLAKSAKK
jgi:hypothetical protein